MQDVLNTINALSLEGILALAVGVIIGLMILFFVLRALSASRKRSDYPRDKGGCGSRSRDEGPRGGGGGRRWRGGR